MALFRKKASAADPPLVKRGQVKFSGFAHLPQPYRKPEKKDLESAQLQRRLRNLAKIPLRQLEEAKNVLSALNRMQLKPESRLQLVENITQIVYPVVARYYEKYQAAHNSLPEGSERRKALMASIDVVSQLAVAYKHLFAGSYHRNSRKLNKEGSILYQYGFRILEFILLEQRLRALRYQKLSRDAWLDCNQIFFVLAAHEHLDEPLALHGVTGMKTRSKSHGPGYVFEVSLRRLYLSIQLFGLLDVSTWPTHLFHVPDNYLESLNYGISLSADSGDEFRAGILLTWQQNDAPPFFERTEKLTPPAIQLDYTAYYNALIKDYEKIASMKFINSFDEKQLSRPVVRVKEEERVPVLQMMLGSLHQRERRSRRHAVFKNNAVRVYFSLSEVMRLLIDMTSKDLKQVLQSRKFTDQLAQSSATVVVDGKQPASTQWEILNFSAGGILIATMETDFSNPVQLGQLVAFVTEEEMRQPSVGFVCRLHRPADRLVEVGITRLANYAEALVIQGVGEQAESIYLPAILLQDSADNWQLVVKPQDDLLPGLPLKLIRSDSHAPARLGNVFLTKKEFTVFELRSPGLKKQMAGLNK